MLTRNGESRFVAIAAGVVGLGIKPPTVGAQDIAGVLQYQFGSTPDDVVARVDPLELDDLDAATVLIGEARLNGVIGGGAAGSIAFLRAGDRELLATASLRSQFEGLAATFEASVGATWGDMKVYPDDQPRAIGDVLTSVWTATSGYRMLF